MGRLRKPPGLPFALPAGVCLGTVASELVRAARVSDGDLWWDVGREWLGAGMLGYVDVAGEVEAVLERYGITVEEFRDALVLRTGAGWRRRAPFPICRVLAAVPREGDPFARL